MIDLTPLPPRLPLQAPQLGMDRFQEKWAALHPCADSARRDQLRGLQLVVEVRACKFSHMFCCLATSTFTAINLFYGFIYTWYLFCFRFFLVDIHVLFVVAHRFCVWHCVPVHKGFIVFHGEITMELPVFGVAPVHESFIVLTDERSIDLPGFAAALELSIILLADQGIRVVAI